MVTHDGDFYKIGNNDASAELFVGVVCRLFLILLE